jgi:hypothetical protein
MRNKTTATCFMNQGNEDVSCRLCKRGSTLGEARSLFFATKLGVYSKLIGDKEVGA